MGHLAYFRLLALPQQDSEEYWKRMEIYLDHFSDGVAAITVS
jgi:hypothetical protein